jgi:hypothetical protein
LFRHNLEVSIMFKRRFIMIERACRMFELSQEALAQKNTLLADAVHSEQQSLEKSILACEDKTSSINSPGNPPALPGDSRSLTAPGVV